MARNVITDYVSSIATLNIRLQAIKHEIIIKRKILNWWSLWQQNQGSLENFYAYVEIDLAFNHHTSSNITIQEMDENLNDQALTFERFVNFFESKLL